MRVAVAVVSLAAGAVVAGGAGGVQDESVVGSAGATSGTGKILLISPPSSLPDRRLEQAQLDGHGRRLIAKLPGAISGAVWSPSGDRVAASVSQRSGTLDRAFLLDAGGRMTAKLQGRVLAGSWSQDGRYLVTDGSAQPSCTIKNNIGLALLKRKPRLLIYVGGALVRTLPVRLPPLAAYRRYSTFDIDGVAWSPRGDRLAFVVSEHDCGNERAGRGPSVMYVVGVSGGRQTAVFGKAPVKSGWSSLGAPTWAPDGRRLAVPTGCLDGANGMGCASLVVVGADGRDGRVVKRDPDEEFTNAVVWPTDDTLVFGKIRNLGRSGIGTIDLRRGRQHWLVRARSDNESVCDYGPLELSASRRDVICDAWNSWPKRQLVVARIDGGGTSRFSYSVGDRDIADVFVP